MRSRFLVLAAALVLLPCSSASARPLEARTAVCGSIVVRIGGNDFSYRIKVVAGRATCRTARSVMRGYIAAARTPRGWFCARGHSREPWAASCARLSPRALVRAYLIAG